AELERTYDAIFIGVGLGETDDLGIPGEDLDGCRDAISFIEDTKRMRFDKIAIARRVAVIGAGKPGVDVATAAGRLRAEEVYMVYRRSTQEMSAFDYEYQLAKQDGVIFVWESLPVRIIADGNKRVAGLECVRTERAQKDSRGRVGAPATGPKDTFVPVPGTEFRLDVEMVVKALGQKRKLEFLGQIADLELKNGCVVVDPATLRTRNPRYFAGGDCVNGGGEVVDAVAHGKLAAAGIHSFLAQRRK